MLRRKRNNDIGIEDTDANESTYVEPSDYHVETDAAPIEVLSTTRIECHNTYLELIDRSKWKHFFNGSVSDVCASVRKDVEENGNNSRIFVDAAIYLLSIGNKVEAFRLLSNLAGKIGAI